MVKTKPDSNIMKQCLALENKCYSDDCASVNDLLLLTDLCVHSHHQYSGEVSKQLGFVCFRKGSSYSWDTFQRSL